MSNEPKLTYSSAPPWYAVEFENDILNTFVIALLTTVISYQATAAVFDMALGFKKKKVASINALQTLLLVRESSPLAILTNLLRSDWLTRRYFHGDIPRETKIARDAEKIRFDVGLRLLVLLAVAPIVNIASISFTLEQAKEMSFFESGVRGVGFGVNKSLVKLKTESVNQACERSIVDVKKGDVGIGEFSICSFLSPSTGIFPRSAGFFAVAVRSERNVIFRVQIGNAFASRRKLALLKANDTTYQIKPVVDKESLEPLLRLGTRLISSKCGFPNPSDVEDIPPHKAGINRLVAARRVNCTPQGDTMKQAVGIVNYLAKYLTLVNTEAMEVSTFSADESPTYFDGRDLVFLRRRKRNLGMATLALVAGVSVLLRAIVAIALRNDIDQGVEVLVKDKLGFKCFESMLHKGEQFVSFNKKYQAGGYAYYGLPRKDMMEVARFQGGIVAGNETVEPWEFEDDL